MKIHESEKFPINCFVELYVVPSFGYPVHEILKKCDAAVRTRLNYLPTSTSNGAKCFHLNEVDELR
jgi:hypothetical protein